MKYSISTNKEQLPAVTNIVLIIRYRVTHKGLDINNLKLCDKLGLVSALYLIIKKLRVVSKKYYHKFISII